MLKALSACQPPEVRRRSFAGGERSGATSLIDLNDRGLCPIPTTWARFDYSTLVRQYGPIYACAKGGGETAFAQEPSC